MSDKERVITKCLVEVKIYGNNPKKLLNKTSVNREFIKNENIVLFLRVLLVSLMKWELIIFILIPNLLFIIKKIDGIKRMKSKEETQFRDSNDVDGSNDENRFVIILIYLLFVWSLN